MTFSVRKKRAFTAFIVSAFFIVPSIFLQDFINGEEIDVDKVVVIEKTCSIKKRSIFGSNYKELTLKFNDKRELVNYQIVGNINYNYDFFANEIENYKTNLDIISNNKIKVSKEDTIDGGLSYDFTVSEFIPVGSLLFDIDVSDISFNSMITSAVNGGYNCDNNFAENINFEKHNIADPFMSSPIELGSLTVNDIVIDSDLKIITLSTTGSTKNLINDKYLFVLFDETNSVISAIDLIDFESELIDETEVFTKSYEEFEMDPITYLIIDKGLLE